jgi:hypothetical protein
MHTHLCAHCYNVFHGVSPSVCLYWNAENPPSRISVLAMSGAVITIDDASATDTILSVKERVFASNRRMRVCRQRLMCRSGPHGVNPLADDETLGGAGVARNGTAQLDMLLADLTEDDAVDLGRKVCLCLLLLHASIPSNIFAAIFVFCVFF